METTDPLAIAAERLLAPIEAEAAPVEEQTEPESEEVELEASDEVKSEEPDQDETESADPEQPKLYSVKVDGKEIKVTLEDLQRSFSGQSYIQQKMQETAAATKRADEAYQALQAEQKRVIELAQAIQEQGMVRPPVMPDPELATTDPVKYIRAKAQYDAEFAKFQTQQQQIEHVRQQSRAATEAAMTAHLQAQAAYLAERIPEFANPETAAKTKERLIKAGQKYGYTEAELMGVTDARAVQVLHKAAQWDELQERTAKAKKTPEASPTVRTAARRPEPAQLARSKVVEAAKKSNRLEDWAAAILK